MRVRRIFTLVLCCLGLSTCGWPVSQSSQATTTACDDDIKKFCADVMPGEGRVITCLAGVKNELTEACRQLYFKAPEPTPADKESSFKKEKAPSEENTPPNSSDGESLETPESIQDNP